MIDGILIIIVIALSLLIGVEIGKYAAWDEAYEEAVDDILDEFKQFEINRQIQHFLERESETKDEEIY